MVRELIIHSNSKGVEIALLENKKLMEYHLDSFEQAGFMAGDIYLGRIKKLNPGLNAAFIDIGHEKDAFIHYSDLSPSLLSLKKFTANAISGQPTMEKPVFQLEPNIPKDGKIGDVLEKGDLVITQILKEAISTKGPRMTCEVTIPGRYLVLAPFNNAIGISKKITDADERQRLAEMIESFRPANFGVVLRTNAQGVGIQELKKDMEYLMEKWDLLSKELLRQQSPKLLLSEMSKSFSLIRDLLNGSFSKIVTDSPRLNDQLKDYLSEVAPQMTHILNLHKDMRPLFEEFDVNRQVRNSFGKTVTLKSGAYIVIEHTEALHVIDVNSGPKINTLAEQDTNAFNVNSEAAYEIARQMRLRDIGGIIVVDFIDMKSQEYRNKLLQIMEDAMSPDKAKHSILPVSKFGLMEITRQRVRSEINIDTTEPLLAEESRMESSLKVIENIEREIESLKEKSSGKKFLLYVHPYVHAYLNKGWLPLRLKWFMKTGKWIYLIEDGSLTLHEYYLLRKEGVSDTYPES